ncbi:MAG: hypothetical protein DYG94_03015 [Leptolyngbya sp. PLA3]|nr:MAG: hypothetical protein EDM82_11285 [Cyanobacteria bacterium CYA]MCE7967700.1 hypothetical protein [Leptolyngbya sp. PL-A3]
MHRLTSVLTLATLAWPSAAQSLEVSIARKHSWGENVGFANWRDAGSPVGAEGVLLEPTFLSGFVWGENVGWINLGDGLPANGTHYANVDGSDFGVNLDSGTGHLSGLGWGENIGWINFTGGAAAAPPRPARFDFDTGRLHGYAWGENIGWINLDDDMHFVAFRCPGDFNDDGVLDFFDVQAFLQAFSAHHPAADLAADGVFNFFDAQTFLNLFSMGCEL